VWGGVDREQRPSDSRRLGREAARRVHGARGREGSALRFAVARLTRREAWCGFAMKVGVVAAVSMVFLRIARAHTRWLERVPAARSCKFVRLLREQGPRRRGVGVWQRPARAQAIPHTPRRARQLGCYTVNLAASRGAPLAIRSLRARGCVCEVQRQSVRRVNSSTGHARLWGSLLSAVLHVPHPCHRMGRPQRGRRAAQSYFSLNSFDFP
jgi:hypothetical protein